MGGLWVARLVISSRTAQKITQVHSITPHEVREAVECRSGLIYTWDEDPERGLRAIVQADIRARRALVVLYPTADPMGDVYNLGSVYFN